MNDPSNVLQQAFSKAHAVAVQNVMNPLLWLNAIGVPLFLAAAYLMQGDLWVTRMLVAVAAAVPLWTLREYSHWRKHDPNRLHSEKYLIEQQQLMIQSKGWTAPIDASALPPGENPEMSLPVPENEIPALPSPHASEVDEGYGNG